MMQYSRIFAVAVLSTNMQPLQLYSFQILFLIKTLLLTLLCTISVLLGGAWNHNLYISQLESRG